MIAVAFIMGFIGSLHCVLMCGPINLAISSKSGKVSHLVAYHAGRILVYAALGLLFGLLGSALAPLVQWQEFLSIGIGVIILLTVFYPYIISRKDVVGQSASRFIARIKKPYNKMIQSGSLSSRFVLGGINGLLPCGMLYTALIGAIGLHSPLKGALFLMFFGLGTLPALAGIMLGGNKLKVFLSKLRVGRFNYAAFVLGLLFILRGMSLGIAYVSPKIVIHSAANGHAHATHCSVETEK